MADLNRINANWDRFSEAQKAELRTRLTPEEKTQLVAMRKGGESTAPTPQAEPKSRQISREILQGLSFGFGDEMTAAGNAGIGFLRGQGKFGDLYSKEVEAERAALQSNRQQFPVQSAVSNIAGSLPLMAIPGANVGKAASLGQAVKQGTKVGATVGALAGYGAGEGGVTERLPGAAEGGAVGGVLGGAIPVAAGILSKGAKKLAAREVVQGLAPTGQAKVLAREVAPELVDRGFVAGTFDGVATKAATKASEAGAQIDQFFNALPDDTTVRVGPILKRMTAKGVDDFIVADLPDGAKLAASTQAEGAIARMQDLKRRLADAATYKNGQLVVPVKTLRKFRQNWDEIAADAKRYGGADLADTSAARAQGLAADAARDAINSSFPELAALNKEFGMWRKTADVAEATALRKQGQSSFVRHIAGAAVGSAIPGVGSVGGILASEALAYPGVRLGNAQVLRGLGAGATMAAPYGGVLGPVSLGQQGILSDR